ncbi:TPA: NGO1622 family putative holin, partial [Neisseria gonorrhoeae]
MKTRNIAFKFAVLAAGYAFGFAKGGGSRTAKGKPADIAAMRMALAQKQAEVDELSAEIWLEERHLNAGEEAGCRRV